MTTQITQKMVKLAWEKSACISAKMDISFASFFLLTKIFNDPTHRGSNGNQ